jgi:hypothetical protein
MMNLYMVIDRTLDEPVGTVHKEQQKALDEMMAYKIEHPNHELEIETMGLVYGADAVKEILGGSDD